MRQKLGAEFDAELYIVDQGQNAESTNDFFYFEFKGIVTNAAISLGVGQLTVSNFNFVTTGPISPKLGIGVITNYVLKEDTDKILLEHLAAVSWNLKLTKPAGGLGQWQISRYPP